MCGCDGWGFRFSLKQKAPWTGAGPQRQPFSRSSTESISPTWRMGERDVKGWTAGWMDGWMEAGGDQQKKSAGREIPSF